MKIIEARLKLISARSEPNPDVVPAPQAQTSSSSPSSTPGDATASSSPQNSQDSLLPPPPLPGHPSAYQTVKRKGTAGTEELEGNLAILGGRPRSVEGFPAELRGARRRRHDEPHLEDDDSVSVLTYFGTPINIHC